MSTPRLISLLVAVAAGLVVSVYGIAYLAASRATTTGVVTSGRSVQSDSPDASSQIAFWSARAADRPRAYLDLTLLGQAYARKARETADIGYYRRAEAALRRALRINPRHVPASVSLAGVLFAQHDFHGSRRIARTVVDHPHGAQALATLGDVHLALGQYGRAQAEYGRLVARSPSASAYSRLAFLADLRGRSEQAVRLMDRAWSLAQASGESGESLAWYAFQIGELRLEAGDAELAEPHYRKALEIFPGYPLALGGLAKARAAQGDHGRAIALYRRVTAAVPQPDHVAALGDLLAAAGDHGAARQQYATVEVIGRLARADRQVYNRQLAIFYADRGMRLREARRLALGELEVRRDVYGLDAAAWALARSGRCAEALPLAREALRYGTKDALLYFHRGYAEGCAGNRAAMRRWYERALALSPEFSVRWAPVARGALGYG